MKKHILIIVASILSISLTGQIETHYADGVTKFEKDASFGVNTDWDQLFSDYHEIFYNRKIGKYRKIIVDYEGNIYMTQKTNHTMYKFSSDGKKVMNIGSQGSGDGQFPMVPKVRGIIDNKYIYTTDVQGRIRLFKLDGSFYKNAKIEYMPLVSVALKNSKIAIKGHVPLSDGVRDIISIKDINTDTEKIIWKKDRPQKEVTKNSVVIDLGDKGLITFNQPFSSRTSFQPQISTTNNGNLLIAYPETGQIEIYNPNGQKIKSFKLDLEPLKITEADMNDYYNAAKERAEDVQKSINENPHYSKAEKEKMIEGFLKGVEMLRDPNHYPSNLPYFAEILIDDSNNLWVVKYSEDEKSESFQLYSFSQEGKYLGTSKIECNDYKVVLNPDQIQFHDGKVIAVVLDKKDEKMPLRLMKFELK